MPRSSPWILLALFGAPALAASLDARASVPAESSRLQEPGPSRAEIDAAVAALRAAFAQPDPELRVDALAEFRVPDARVVPLLARGLDDEDARVRQAAIEALRWTPHRDALRTLHKCCKRDSELRSDEELGPMLYRAIGQHADPSSIEVLQSKLYSEPNRAIVGARIWALGNIRDRKALEALVELLRGAPARVVMKHAPALRVSLIQLTGVDRGESPERWQAWWSENRRAFEMAEQPPLMPVDLQRRWDSFWGIRRILPREERREDRGGDEKRDS